MAVTSTCNSNNTQATGTVYSGMFTIPPIDIMRKILMQYLMVNDIVSFCSTNRHLYTKIFSDHLITQYLFKEVFPQSFSDLSENLAEEETSAAFNQAKLRRMNAKSGDCLYQWHYCKATPGVLTARNDRLYYAAGPKITVWDYQTGGERELETSILPEKKSNSSLVGYYDMIYSDEDYLIVGNEDSTIIFDRKTEKEIWAFPHRNKEWEARKTRMVHNKQLFFGFRDGTIRIWDLKEPKKDPKIVQAHSSSITTMVTQNNRLYTGSEDGTIKIWDLNDIGELRKLKRVGARAIRTIFIQENSLIADDTLSRAIWDLEKKCDPIVIRYNGPMEPCLLHKKTLFCKTGNEIIMQNPHDLEPLKVFSTNDEVGLSNITIHDGLLFGSCSDIKIWADLPHVKNQIPSSTVGNFSNHFIIYKGRLFTSSWGVFPALYVWDFNRPSSQELSWLKKLNIESKKDFFERVKPKVDFYVEIGMGNDDEDLSVCLSSIGIYADEDLTLLGITPDQSGLEKLQRYLSQKGLIAAWHKYNLNDIYSLSQLSARPELFQEFSKSFLE